MSYKFTDAEMAELHSFEDSTTPTTETTTQNHGDSYDPIDGIDFEPVEPHEYSTEYEEQEAPKEKQVQVQEQFGHVGDQEINAVLDKLLQNYDKNTYIPPPERIGIFVRKYINILAGQAGVGKSWQVIRWARDLSTGGECFGGVVENEPPRRVLIIAGELPKVESERRCRLLEEGDGRTRNYDNFTIVDVKEAEANRMPLILDNSDGQGNIEKLIAYRKPDIVFFDSFVSLFSGDEKDSKDVNGGMQFLERIAEQYNIAAVVIHHIRKRLARDQGLPINLDDIIGSSIFSRRSGFMYATAKVDYSPDGFNSKKIVLVKEVKSWLQPVKAYAFDVKSGFYGKGIVMDITPNIEDEEVALMEGIHQKKNEGKKVPADWESLILTFLKGKGTEGASVTEINEAIGREKKQYNNTSKQIQRLKDEGKVTLVQGKRGVYSLPNNINSESESENQSEESQGEIDFDNSDDIQE